VPVCLQPLPHTLPNPDLSLVLISSLLKHIQKAVASIMVLQVSNMGSMAGIILDTPLHNIKEKKYYYIHKK
jgi:hypothetical protein